MRITELAIVFGLLTVTIGSAFADDLGLCGPEPEKYVCGYLPPASNFDREQATARSNFSKLKYSTMMAGYELARQNCGLRPAACPGPCDPILDPLDARYKNTFDESDDGKFRACVMQSMQTAVMNTIHAHSSITQTQIDQFFAQMKQKELELVANESAFTDSQKADIRSEVSQTLLMSADRFPQVLKYLGGSDASSPYAFGCEPKLTPTAFLTYGYASFETVPWVDHVGAPETTKQLPQSPGPNNYLAACPGFYLELLNTTSSDPFENWYRILGHELAHGFHAYLKRSTYIERSSAYDATIKNWNPNLRFPEESTYWSNYQPILNCLQNQYSPSASRSDERDLIQGSVPSAYWENQFTPILGRPANDLELHMLEYTAEYWGMKTLAAMVELKPESERILAAYNGAKLLCPGPGMQQYMNADVDGTHPSVSFRIRMAFRNPELRRALGCSSDQAPYGGPWCELSSTQRL